MNISRTLLAACLLSCATAFLSLDLPTGWFKAGSKPESYEMGVDKGAHNGKNAATIRSIDKKINGFGTLMQNSAPNEYWGKRVRMTAFVKTKDVTEWAGIWFRIDQKGSHTPLGFDNMLNGKKDRSIRGTNDWKKYDIVLDVPDNAINLAYGALLVGTGQIWFDDVKFEVVGTDVATTGIVEQEQNKPTNLDFEK